MHKRQQTRKQAGAMPCRFILSVKRTDGFCIKSDADETERVTFDYKSIKAEILSLLLLNI